MVTEVILTHTKTCQYYKKQVSVSEILLTKLTKFRSHNNAHTNYYTFTQMIHERTSALLGKHIVKSKRLLIKSAQ